MSEINIFNNSDDMVDNYSSSVSDVVEFYSNHVNDLESYLSGSYEKIRKKYTLLPLLMF